MFHCMITLVLIMVSAVVAQTELSDANIRDAVKDYLAGGSNYGPIGQWDVSEVTDMKWMFDSAATFNDDVSQWNVSNVTNMWGMFDSAASFNGDVSQWDVSNVTYMGRMFYNATSFNDDLSQWNISNVMFMDAMFYDATLFNCDLSQWDVSNVSDMQWMFAYATSFNNDLSQWNVSNVSNMWGMFYSAASFNGDLRQWDVSNVTNMEYIFYYATSFNGNLSQWDVSNVTNMSSMFRSATSFNGNISQWDISKVSVMTFMFYQAKSFHQDICWDVSNVDSYDDVIFNGSSGQIADYPKCSHPSLINNPFNIISGLSTDNEKWCIYPANNYLYEGTKIVIGKCNMNWGTFQWMFDFEGKLKNVKDPSFCIHIQGQRMMIKKCVDGLQSQLWRYNINRMLFAKNGRKGVVVRNYVASEKAEVKNQVYNISDATDAATWNLQYVVGDILDMPTYTTFRIVSDLTTNDKKWCMYPANNAIATIGTKLVLSICKDWKSFKWTMDNQGKIKNVMDPAKCITRMGKRIQINECADNLSTQRWAYNIIDKKLSFLINGQVQVTVNTSKASTNAQVKALPSVVPGPSYQTWEFERN